jgi:UDP-glucose 4-epimerase
MKVLAAAAESGIRKVILRSSTAVYGAHPNNSAFLTEDTPLRGSRRYGNIRDLIEIEAFVNGFRGQSPETNVTVLRFSNIVGLTADTPMTRFLKMQSPVVLLGFDPLMQLIHEDDVVEALVFSVLNDVSGTFNVSAEGPMPLSRILRLTRRVPMRLFHPFAYKSLELLSGTRFQPKQYVPIEWDYLRYPWVTDLTRMQTEMGFYPIYLAEEALREFAGQQHADAEDGQADLQLTDEQQLRDIIERRRRIRERQSADGEDSQD